MTIDQLSAFLGWCLLLNLGFITFLYGMSLYCMDFMFKFAKGLGVTKKVFQESNLSIMRMYEVLIILFNLVPWLALCCMN